MAGIWAISAIGSRSPTCSTCWPDAGGEARDAGQRGCAVRALALRDSERAIPPPAAETPAADNTAGIVAHAGPRRRRHRRHADDPAGGRAAGRAANRRVRWSRPAMRRLKTYDTWARLNRFTYRFNARIDEALFLPVANGYRRVVPAGLRGGVHNFFGNLAELDSVVNYTLQGA